MENERRPFGIRFNRDKKPSNYTGIVGLGAIVVGSLFKNEAVYAVGELVSVYYGIKWVIKLHDRIIGPSNAEIKKIMNSGSEVTTTLPARPVPERQIYISDEQIDAVVEDSSKTLDSEAEEFLRNIGDQNSQD